MLDSDAAAAARRRARGGRGLAVSDEGATDAAERAERADGAGLGARSVNGPGADSVEGAIAGLSASGTSTGAARGALAGRAGPAAVDGPPRPTLATAAAISVVSTASRFGRFVLAGRGCASGLRCLPRFAGEVSVSSASEVSLEP